jgi:hypothetical protein
MTNDDDEILTCPECGSHEITVETRTLFMVNTGEHFCHSVKTQDANARCNCLFCDWEGQRHNLKEKK